MLGAGSAFGVDIDETAVRTAVENAELNNVGERFKAICGDLTDKVSGKYGWIYTGDEKLVAAIFGGQAAVLSRIIYTIVGATGLWCTTLLFRDRATVRE